jgi:hypothetical protein
MEVIDKHPPATALSPGKKPVNIQWETKWAYKSGGFGEEKNILLLPEFEPRTVKPTQPSSYTDYAIPVPDHSNITVYKQKCNNDLSTYRLASFDVAPKPLLHLNIRYISVTKHSTDTGLTWINVFADNWKNFQRSDSLVFFVMENPCRFKQHRPHVTLGLPVIILHQSQYSYPLISNALTSKSYRHV